VCEIEEKNINHERHEKESAKDLCMCGALKVWASKKEKIWAADWSLAVEGKTPNSIKGLD